MRWKVLVVCAASVAFFAVFAGQAFAGYAVQPANGTQTSLSPTFLVYLDGADSTAEVHVSTTATVDGSGSSADEIGSCSPTTAATEPDTYTCQPSLYSGSGSAALTPGTYFWWLTFFRTDPGNTVPTLHVSGPFQFTAVAPTAPAGVSLLSPADGATVSATPRLAASLPAGVAVRFYVSDSSAQAADGSPVGASLAGCTGTVTDAGTYDCAVDASSELAAGSTYYWWIVVDVNGGSFVYGPRSFTVAQAPPGGGGSGGGGGGGGSGPAPHGVSYAPYLRSSGHYGGRSVKQTKLASAAYALSKLIGRPKSIAVACWSSTDWANIVGENPESGYTVLGFWMPSMPHWLELSPGICRTMETLVYHRPRYANRFTANGVDTLTHEMVHALGVRNEAMTECFAMQLSWITAHSLGVPLAYSFNLSHLSLQNYHLHPPAYVNDGACREDGAWDLWKGRPSPPWHQLAL